MKDKFFIDTNIFVYSFDLHNSDKRMISENLIKAALKGNGIISFQVIQEFLNVATKEFQGSMTNAEAQKYLSKVLFTLCQVFPTEELYIQALEIKNRWRFSFYDSLIISAALEAKCNILYSEDLQHNQKVGGLTIINPYL
jgi:predicted nucleic acid-binding protein